MKLKYSTPNGEALVRPRMLCVVGSVSFFAAAMLASAPVGLALVESKEAPGLNDTTAEKKSALPDRVEEDATEIKPAAPEAPVEKSTSRLDSSFPTAPDGGEVDWHRSPAGGEVEALRKKWLLQHPSVGKEPAVSNGTVAPAEYPLRLSHTVPTYSAAFAFQSSLRPLRLANTVTIISDDAPPPGYYPELEHWVRFPDVNDTRISSFASRWVHQLRVHKHFQDEHDFFLVGDDDTIFFIKNIRTALRNLDPDVPLYLSDDLGGDCHRGTSRKSRANCVLFTNSTCLFEPSKNTGGAYVHGGFGAILSRGLVKLLSHEHLIGCELSAEYGRYCDERLTRCIREAGIDVTVTSSDISKCKFGRFSYSFPSTLLSLNDEQFHYFDTEALTEQLESALDESKDFTLEIEALSKIGSLGP